MWPRLGWIKYPDCASYQSIVDAEVFFTDEQYHFKKDAHTVIALQRTDDAWQVAAGDVQLKDEAAKLLDQYLMSQH